MATKQALAYKEKGNAAFKAGKHALAIENYTYATEMDPNNPVFYTNRSNAYFMMENYDKSERDARKAIAKKDSWEKGHYRLGMALWKKEKYVEAKAALEQAISLQPTNAVFMNALAQVKASMMKGMSCADIIKLEGNEAFKKGQIEPAVEIYTRAISACKNDEKDQQIKAACLANRAACYRQLYLPEKCVADCSDVLAMQPYHQKALIRRAQAYESMEKYEEALEDYQLCTRINPNAAIAMTAASRIRKALKSAGKM